MSFRDARAEDLPILVSMLADDPLGSQRENPGPPLPRTYRDAFAAIDADPNHHLLLAEASGRIGGFLQLTYLPYLTYQGRWRAMVEGVRVARELRGQGLGRSLLEQAIAMARAKGCHLIQLTTDKNRPKAAAFYETLGFRPTHEGMKLHLDR